MAVKARAGSGDVGPGPAQARLVREKGGVGPWQRKGCECRGEATAAGGDSPRVARFRATYHTPPSSAVTKPCWLAVIVHF
jgi:hypothetical protein